MEVCGSSCSLALVSGNAVRLVMQFDFSACLGDQLSPGGQLYVWYAYLSICTFAKLWLLKPFVFVHKMKTVRSRKSLEWGKVRCSCQVPYASSLLLNGR